MTQKLDNLTKKLSESIKNPTRISEKNILKKVKTEVGAQDVRFRVVDFNRSALVYVPEWTIGVQLENIEPELAKRIFWDNKDPSRMDCAVGKIARIMTIWTMQQKGISVPLEMMKGLYQKEIKYQNCYSFEFINKPKDKSILNDFINNVVKKKKEEIKRKEKVVLNYVTYIKSIKKDDSFFHKAFTEVSEAPWSDEKTKTQWEELWKINAQKNPTEFTRLAESIIQYYANWNSYLQKYLKFLNTLKYEIVLPVMVGLNFYGVMNLHKNKEFTPYQKELASYYAGLLAVAYFYKRTELFESFRKVEQVIASEGDLETIASRIADGIRKGILGIEGNEVFPLLYTCNYPISPFDKLDNFGKRWEYHNRKEPSKKEGNEYVLFQMENKLGDIPIRDDGLGKAAIKSWQIAAKGNMPQKARDYFLVCDDVDDPNSNFGSRSALKAEIKTTACLPLVFDRQVYGLLYIHCKSRHYFTEFDIDALEPFSIQAAASINHAEPSDFEYRVPRAIPSSIEKVKFGDVLIRHSLTSICPSEIAYFEHRKDRKILDQRLPMALGHETTGVVQQVRGKHIYKNTKKTIKSGDSVVVIPLIPCGSCKICKGDYGENYCPSARYMASDTSGSLRTKYRYDPNLLLKIPEGLAEDYALFTELMSNLVQVLYELGFKEKENRYEFKAIFRNKQTFSHFHFPTEGFASILDAFTSEEQTPRTVYFLDPQGEKPTEAEISLYNIQRKGLALFGGTEKDLPSKKIISTKKPHILVLGDGPLGYLLVLLLSKVFKIPSDQLYVVGGSTNQKIQRVQKYAGHTWLRYKDLPKDTKKACVSLCRQSGRTFDIVFECAGREAMDENIKIGINCLKENGVLGVIGLNGKKIKVDFNKFINKHLYMKGFCRGSIKSFENALRYIAKYPEVKNGLDDLKGKIEDVSNPKKLIEILNKVAKTKPLYRQIVRLR